MCVLVRTPISAPFQVLCNQWCSHCYLCVIYLQNQVQCFFIGGCNDKALLVEVIWWDTECVESVFYIFRKCVLWFSSRSIWKCWRMDSITKPLTASVTKWPHSNLTLSMCASWARKPSGSLIYYLRNKMNPKEIIRLCSSDFTIYVRWLVVQG